MNPDCQGSCPACQQWMGQMCAHCRDLVVKTVNDVWAAWWAEVAPSLYKNLVELPILDSDRICELLQLDEDVDDDESELLPLQYEDLSCWQTVALMFIYVVVLVLLAVLCRCWRGQHHVQMQTDDTQIVEWRQEESIISEQSPRESSILEPPSTTEEEPTKSKREKKCKKLCKRSKKKSQPTSEQSSKYEAPSKSKETAGAIVWGGATAETVEISEKSASESIKSRRPTGFPRDHEVPKDDSPPLSGQPSRAAQPVPIFHTATTSEPPMNTRESESTGRARINYQSPTTLSPIQSERRVNSVEPSTRVRISNQEPDSERPSSSEQPSKPSENAASDSSEPSKQKNLKLKAWLRYKIRPIFVHNHDALRRQQNKYKENERFKELNTERNIEKWTKAREKNERKRQIKRESAESKDEKMRLAWGSNSSNRESEELPTALKLPRR
ncbi:NF-kappa-B-activating protein [Drosophila mojavensis]|uniref:Uncharacterized protein n=1 Tax=Drosophila mojavensis TaxID=7230 RepID=B4KEW3_DROMO|nr:NF-kappa-B-activating protein [Drosophila mojavensis]EDW11932.1 uncharacterized protein Dmoj_GI12462 [Drosophila mojavensis]